jgi:hypothetical protein
VGAQWQLNKSTVCHSCLNPQIWKTDRGRRPKSLDRRMGSIEICFTYNPPGSCLAGSCSFCCSLIPEIKDGKRNRSLHKWVWPLLNVFPVVFSPSDLQWVWLTEKVNLMHLSWLPACGVTNSRVIHVLTLYTECCAKCSERKRYWTVPFSESSC